MTDNEIMKDLETARRELQSITRTMPGGHPGDEYNWARASDAAEELRRIARDLCLEFNTRAMR